MPCTKVSAQFEFQGHRSRMKVTRDKKRQSAAFFRERPSGGAIRAVLRVVYVWENIVQFYAGGKINACCLFVYVYFLAIFSRIFEFYLWLLGAFPQTPATFYSWPPHTVFFKRQVYILFPIAAISVRFKYAPSLARIRCIMFPFTIQNLRRTYLVVTDTVYKSILCHESGKTRQSVSANGCYNTE